MIRRCYDPGDVYYRNYGGRGIRVCAEWLEPQAFIDWINANLGPRPAGTTGTVRRAPMWTLDRIENDGHYEPGNLRWATRAQQSSNRRPRAAA